MPRNLMFDSMNAPKDRFIAAFPAKVAFVIYKDKTGKEVRRFAFWNKLTGWVFVTSAEEGRQMEIMGKGIADQVDTALKRYLTPTKAHKGENDGSEED